LLRRVAVAESVNVAFLFPSGEQGARRCRDTTRRNRAEQRIPRREV
jgi:hypothetical protein